MNDKSKPGRKKTVTEEPLALTSADSNKAQESQFPVVGIGASAGGLEALELFLKNVPPSSGMAFIIVQHLDPTHKGIMAELLQRATPMPVCQISDDLVVKKNNVYIIPPNKDLTLFHGVLRLLDPVKPRGLRLPIDFFFRSLADDLMDLSIGVIVSGMGSDGMLGLRAIKEAGGGSFVQDPLTSKFDGMPRSSIDAGLADVVAPVEELPAKIIDFIHHRSRLVGSPSFTLNGKTASAFDKIMLILRLKTGHDFSLYKKSTMYRRIERRMGIHDIEKIHDYVRFLQNNTTESELLFNELLIGVTSFFRDPAAWEKLKQSVIPFLLASHPDGGVLRAWSIGCSTGEEAYSLAMIFKEVIEELKPERNYTFQIFATDLDKHAIDIARDGSYPKNIVADVSEARLRRFFINEEGRYRLNKGIRDQIVFAPHNLIKDPPFTKLDILICRNLMIYMEPELQKRLFPLFHYSLNKGGFLFLGSAENIYGSPEFFVLFDGPSHIFQRSSSVAATCMFNFADTFSGVFKGIFPNKSTEEQKEPSANLATLADRLLLDCFAPVSVLTTRRGDIVYINGRTGKYLEPVSGKANWNIFVMIREGLKFSLSRAFENAVRTKKSVTVEGVHVKSSTESVLVQLTVEPIEKPEQLSGMFLIVFTEKSAFEEKNIKAAAGSEKALYEGDCQLMEELKLVRAELLASHEEMQSSHEELKSMNEELLSSNEELQSTNEELSTAKEEMQSLNEELQTVNQELQGKVDELVRTSDDMKNLLNSTEIATLFLDEKLNIRSFTKAMLTISKYTPLDKGRPFTDITSILNYSELHDDAVAVLDTLVCRERQISTTDGRWFVIRIMPYCTQKNRINGLVITFIDITLSKRLEIKLLDVENRFMVLFKHMHRGAFFLDRTGAISMINPATEWLFRLKKADVVGRSFKDLDVKLVSESGLDFTPDADPFSLAFSSRKAYKGEVVGFYFTSEKRYLWVLCDVIPQFFEENLTLDFLCVMMEEIADPGAANIDHTNS
jgi:two-component system CheB/CheR fusion protein